MKTKEHLTGDYRQYMDKRFLGEWDLPEKDDLIVTIVNVSVQEVESERGASEKLTAYLQGESKEELKPMILNVTNSEAISEATGSKKVEDWSGRKISLYRDRVKAFGKTTLCIRVRPFPPKEEKIHCSNCGAEVAAYGNYTARQMAEISKAKFNQILCVNCGKKMGGEINENN